MLQLGSPFILKIISPFWCHSVEKFMENTVDMFIFQEIIIGKPKRIKKTAVVFFLISIAPEFLVLTFLLKFLVFILFFFLCSPFFFHELLVFFRSKDPWAPYKENGWSRRQKLKTESSPCSGLHFWGSDSESPPPFLHLLHTNLCHFCTNLCCFCHTHTGAG